ncbi:hypothetical protein ACLSY0_03110 [Avibacterium avium]|uniref:hypothetical protein n=2 Tax=Pasteurellaceae TaxID=712 RepID=UPI003BF8B261
MLLNLSCYYNEFAEKQNIPFSKQQIDDDMDKLSYLKRKFQDIEEVPMGDKWQYSFDYEQGLKELDEILLKYIPFLRG